MIFYHFTSLENLPSIREHGINKGEVPLTPNHTINAAWLTTDKEPNGHGLTSGGPVGKNEIIALKAAGLLSRNVSDDAKLTRPNKRAVRITVRVPLKISACIGGSFGAANAWLQHGSTG